MGLDVADHGETGRGGDGVGRERVAGLVLDALGSAPPEGAGHGLGEHHGREWRIATREPLTHAEDVRPDTGLLGGEPGPEAPEPRHDLVEDEQHARLVAERAQPVR